MEKKIAVVGAGAFGFAIAKHLSDILNDKKGAHKGSSYDNSKRVFLYDIDKELINHIIKKRTHKYFFPEIKVNEVVTPTLDANIALKDSDLVVLSIPTQFVRKFLNKNRKLFKDGVCIVNCSKGMELSTNKVISEIVDDEMQGKEFIYSVLSGGMVASEFISGFGVFGADLACEDEKCGLDLQKLFSSKKLKVFLTEDVKGIEVAGALKNVISIASGFMDGIGFPFGSKTLVISLASNEIKCISGTLNAKSHTYEIQTQAFGNDYVMSTLGNSRNRYLGELIGKGMTPSQALLQLKKEKKTAEGYYTTKVAYELAKENKLKVPIVEMVYEVLYKNKDIRSCIDAIMLSDLEPSLNCRYYKM